MPRESLPHVAGVTIKPRPIRRPFRGWQTGMGKPQFGPNLRERCEQGARAATRIGNSKSIKPRRHTGREPAVALNRIDKIEDK